MPPPPPPLPTPPPQSHPASSSAGSRTPAWLHAMAWAGALLGPVALLAPPRRAGLQALALAAGTSVCTNVLAYDYTGESLAQRMVRRARSLGGGGGDGDGDGDGAAAAAARLLLPDKARHTQELLRRERERREAALPAEERAARERARRGLLERLWGGAGPDGGREERARKTEGEALARQGKGYGDLVVEHVREAFAPKKGAEQVEKDGTGGKGGENEKP